MRKVIVALEFLLGHAGKAKGGHVNTAGAVSPPYKRLVRSVESGSSGTLEITIPADTNRDGTVDVQGRTEYLSRHVWTQQSGALFLANIVDTDRRCSSGITNRTPDEDLESCYDASDNVLRNETYLAPLRTLPLNYGLSQSAVGSVAVSGVVAASKTRIFHKKDTKWVHINANHTFSAQELKAALELGIDARDVRRPGGWDGRARVEFTVRDSVSRVEAKDLVEITDG